MAGAANSTIGSIVSQARSQDRSQCDMKESVARNGALATAAAIAQVKQDWMTPNTKWLNRRGIPSMEGF
jgi:hypothetical protein